MQDCRKLKAIVSSEKGDETFSRSENASCSPSNAISREKGSEAFSRLAQVCTLDGVSEKEKRMRLAPNQKTYAAAHQFESQERNEMTL